MGIGGIAWSAFSWEAFSTLTTGALAVVAAVVVGLRQTEIQRRQTNLQETTLRSDLCDRRYRVFERAEQFLREILQEGADPSPETQRDFVIGTGEARFLFKENVHEGLREIYAKWADFHTLKRHPEQQVTLREWFLNRFTTLPDLFDELKLSGEIAPR